MPIYQHKIDLIEWKPIYFNYILESLRSKTGCGKLEKIADDGFIQATFYDASFLNNDKMTITITFAKLPNSVIFSFVAVSDYIKWFEWDKSTESLNIAKYSAIFKASLKSLIKKSAQQADASETMT